MTDFDGQPGGTGAPTRLGGHGRRFSGGGPPVLLLAVLLLAGCLVLAGCVPSSAATSASGIARRTRPAAPPGWSPTRWSPRARLARPGAKPA